MTRFARAKGSKASNEKAPEHGTPWEVMKEQLLQSKKDNEEAKHREEAEQKRIENYEKFLNDRKTQKRKSTWFDFPVTEQSKISTNIQADVEQLPKKKNKSKKTISADETKDLDNTQNSADKPSKKKKKKQNVDSLNLQEKEESDTHSKAIKPDIDILTKSNIEKSADLSSKVKKKKSKKNKMLKTAVQNDSQSNLNVQDCNETVKQNNEKKAGNKNTQKKTKKFTDKQPSRRKPVNDNSFQLIINGKDVELIRFDGFPIMRKDAERLEELKKSMINKGIPKSEVQRTIKLERRRAEKALARLKRDVCYNCRKGGHNLSDCPELKSKIPGSDAPEGICFKCGSTEHRQFECKVQRDKEFRFATCFICKQSGHIARQCPDNPKGLYPNGGGCKLCGDVTHLRKDCPTVQNQKEVTSVKLSTLDSTDNVEDMTYSQPKENSVATAAPKKPKKIKF